MARLWEALSWPGGLQMSEASGQWFSMSRQSFRWPGRSENHNHEGRLTVTNMCHQWKDSRIHYHSLSTGNGPCITYSWCYTFICHLNNPEWEVLYLHAVEKGASTGQVNCPRPYYLGNKTRRQVGFKQGQLFQFQKDVRYLKNTQH